MCFYGGVIIWFSQQARHSFMRKIPPGAEASNVLVGEVDFLRRPIIAFVRLAQSVPLGDLTEVPIPTRFLFIMLGPTSDEETKYRKYHEIGRCIATLMSDQVFHGVAYKAKTVEDLLAGIDEFMDQVTVLPPGMYNLIGSMKWIRMGLHYFMAELHVDQLLSKPD